ncbi:hypothetical protein AVEN_26725-1 [Araneus ventricosus]|uniref:Uncharacterized protein n=1 Tax=Araneus ventricosus TaxID=182803 RepID=A0A4Y2IMJ2_ARAVE|nr:hypothetical protein AVEN_26725-1 [Araneus ventricosus]
MSNYFGSSSTTVVIAKEPYGKTNVNSLLNSWTFCLLKLHETGHCPLPSFLNRFHLSDDDSCACGEIGDPIHYATSCTLTLSWRTSKPSISLESLWYQRVLENPNSRKIIINMINHLTE